LTYIKFAVGAKLKIQNGGRRRSWCFRRFWYQIRASILSI